MKNSGNLHAILLIAVTAAAVAACGGKDTVSPADVESQAFEDLRDEVRAVVEDPAQEAKVIQLVDAMQDDLETLRGSLEKRSNRIKELNADYDTTRADFEALLEDAETELRRNRQSATETQLALSEALSPEERAQIGKARSKAMAAAIKSMQSI